MRIAVELSGHMRSFEKTWESWDKFVFQKYSPNVFIHSWWNRGTFRPLPPSYETAHDEVGTTHVNDDIIDADLVEKLYNPCGMVIENYDDVKHEWEQKSRELCEYRHSLGPKWAYCRVHDILSAVRKTHLCNELKNEYSDVGGYDLVIKARPDLLLKQDIIECSIPNLVEPYTYFVRSGHPKDEDPLIVQSVIPEVAIGREYTIDHYCNFYNDIDFAIVAAQANNTPERVLNHHTAIYWWMKDNGFDYNIFPHHAYEILR